MIKLLRNQVFVTLAFLVFGNANFGVSMGAVQSVNNAPNMEFLKISMDFNLSLLIIKVAQLKGRLGKLW